MSVKHTKLNMVCAYEPTDEDSFVETWIIGSEQRYCLLTQRIDQYDEAVDWAVGMADEMERHIDVIPITGAEWLQKHGEKYLAT